MNTFILTLIILTPFVGAFVGLFAGTKQFKACRSLALIFSLIALAETLFVALKYNPQGDYLQFVCRGNWVNILGIQYYLGVSGINVLLIVLTALLVPFAMMVASPKVRKPRLFFSMILFTQTGLFGTFTAQNFFHWFFFWELVLIPAFFLVKLWGGSKKDDAAMQFFIYTMFGSIFMFLGFQALYLATGTFNFDELAKLSQTGELTGCVAKAFAFSGLSGAALCSIIFWLVLLGFAVKIPLMPFHTWLPDTYTEAPTSVSILLTGLLSKMGMYGFLAILAPIFAAQMNEWFSVLIVPVALTIIASAWTALAQKDIKRMLAYSSINHLGYCMLGALAAVKILGIGTHPEEDRAFAMDGAVLQMFNHGITAGAMFGFVALLEVRTHNNRIMRNYSGLRGTVPIFSTLFCIATFSSLGLPGLNGFVSEFLIFKGAFAMSPIAVLCCGTALVMTALFLLNMIQTMLTGKPSALARHFKEMTVGEICVFAPFILIMFIIGIAPGIVIDRFITPGVNFLLHINL